MTQETTLVQKIKAAIETGETVEFDYNGTNRVVYLDEMSGSLVGGFVASETHERCSGWVGENGEPYKRFDIHKMNNVKFSR